jgi:helicase
MIVLVKRKKLWEMYPIGKAKDALNSRRIPVFIAYLKFKHSDSGLKLNRFIIVKDNEEKIQAPSNAIKILRKQVVLLADKDKEMEKFLNSQGIKFHYTRICNHCRIEGMITIINSSFTYSYHNQEICKICGENIISSELNSQGFSKKSFKNFKRLIEKTGDLDKVLSILNHNFDPLLNPELTLFDKINPKKDSKIPKIAINRLKIPKEFKNTLSKDKYLLPIQYLSIKKGLLKGENLLVVSGTGSGKTFVGELAAIPRALKGEKFLFLSPLVALSNQKYRDFKDKYESLGLKVAIKVGKSRIKAKNELHIRDSDISDSDVIVATYEGIDFLIRSGKYKELNTLGCVVIDEVHSLDDEDRGLRLNGLIRRIMKLFPKAQIIGLSATVKNQIQLSKDFNLKLVQFGDRPVPLERHLIFLRNEVEKRYLIKDLVIKESKIKSSKGYLGQSIIFTNSRRKTHQIANFLVKQKVSSAAYHAGLSYYKKERIEKDFAKGKISAVVTTAALAAGVDFPASQVIFESLLMGNKWISPTEFFQMLGRAGRPSYHDRGVVYLIPEIANEFDGESEDAIAISLLESEVDDVTVKFNESDFACEILADISSKVLKNIEEIYEFYDYIDLDIDMAIDELRTHKLIRIKKSKSDKKDLNQIKSNEKALKNLGLNKYSNEDVFLTKYGKAVSVSFLDLNTANLIKKSLYNIKDKIANNYSDKIVNKYKNDFKRMDFNLKNLKLNKKTKNLLKTEDINILSDILELLVSLEPFENVYLSANLHKHIVSKIKVNFSSRLFAESTLDIISSGETINKLDQRFQDALLKIQLDFLRCECKEKPFCQCLQINLSKLILKERLENKDPDEISKKLFKNYQIMAYSGDIYSWLDNIVRLLDAIKRIAEAFDYETIVNCCQFLIKIIEG